MENITVREEKIEQLKKELIERYLYIRSCVFFFYILYFTFFLKSTFMQLYVLCGLLVIVSVWLILKDKLRMEQFMRVYLIFAPIYSFTTILLFWQYTVTNFVWLIPIPIGAYIFFTAREVMAYSIYAIFIIIIASLASEIISIPFIKASLYEIKISDIFLFVSHIIIIGFLLYYKDKIRSLKTIINLEKQQKTDKSTTLDEKEIKQYKDLFDKMESLMREEQVFKNPNFNIASLSEMLKISTTYASRAIRYSKYPNFNNYINSYRIEYVINLLHTADLEKVTLLYIYSEAGYRNQSTFNTAFKKLKKITPSEYISNISNEERIVG